MTPQGIGTPHRLTALSPSCLYHARHAQRPLLPPVADPRFDRRELLLRRCDLLRRPSSSPRTGIQVRAHAPRHRRVDGGDLGAGDPVLDPPRRRRRPLAGARGRQPVAGADGHRRGAVRPRPELRRAGRGPTALRGRRAGHQPAARPPRLDRVRRPRARAGDGHLQRGLPGEHDRDVHPPPEAACRLRLARRVGSVGRGGDRRDPPPQPRRAAGPPRRGCNRRTAP